MQQSNLEALKRACLYSLPANKLGYCGPQGSWKAFQQFLQNPTQGNAATAKALLKKFYALYPYLELIAKANDLQPFDEQVVEAYWVGSKLLESVPHSALQKTILSFQNFGLPKSIAEKKAASLPNTSLPHHSLHVLYINFISQKVQPLIPNLSSCLVQWATVKEAGEKAIMAKGIELIAEGGEVKLKEKIKTVQNPFSLQPSPNDTISVHWNSAIEVLTKNQAQALKNYTLKTLGALRHQHQ